MRTMVRCYAGLCAAAMSAAMVVASLGGCDQQQQQQTQAAEQAMPEIRPNLPPVPNVPPPRHKISYDDGAFSVYGLRKRLRQNIDNEVRVKAYIVKVYEAPECPEDRTCPAARMPNLWLGDDLDETNTRKLVQLVGYAQSQQDIIDARERNEKGTEMSEEELAALPPVVFDWQSGKRYVVKGNFTHASGAGFASSDGLLEYREHSCLDCPAETE